MRAPTESEGLKWMNAVQNALDNEVKIVKQHHQGDTESINSESHLPTGQSDDAAQAGTPDVFVPPATLFVDHVNRTVMVLSQRVQGPRGGRGVRRRR